MPPARFNEETHWVVVDDTVDVDSAAGESTSVSEDNYIYLDFDHLRDDALVLDTRTANRLVLRSIAEQAEAMRVLPLEKVETTVLSPRV